MITSVNHKFQQFILAKCRAFLASGTDPTEGGYLGMSIRGYCVYFADKQTMYACIDRRAVHAADVDNGQIALINAHSWRQKEQGGLRINSNKV